MNAFNKKNFTWLSNEKNQDNNNNVKEGVEDDDNLEGGGDASKISEKNNNLFADLLNNFTFKKVNFNKFFC